MRYLFFLALILAACSQPAPNKFSDAAIVKIYDLKDRRSTDSLLTFYLRSENPVYRREAALAFASIQDSSVSIELGNVLLEDSDAEVRRNAAFALGQTSGFQAVNALIPSLGDGDRWVVRESLEALGKSIESKDFEVLTQYHSIDTLLQEGLSWAFYRLALRSKADSTITKSAAELLKPDYSFQTRLAAAHYFGRSAKLTGGEFGQALLTTAQEDKHPEVRMMAVSGFRHLAFEKIKPVLMTVLQKEQDYRVRVNAVRVCQNFPLTETESIVFGALQDAHEMVQVVASEVIRNQSEKFPLERITEDLRTTKNWRVKANLYGALLKSLPHDQAVDEIIKEYEGAPVYFRSALASALGESKPPLNKSAFVFLSSELNKGTNEKVILSSSAAAIVSLNRKPGNKISNSEFLEVYKKAIVQRDPAIIGIISSALTDTTLRYKNDVKDLQFLYDAKAGMTLPKDIESLLPLERAIAYLEGKERPRSPENQFNHPIAWDLVKKIPMNQEVEIKTSRGDIRLRLYVEEDPGSVVNFTSLVAQQYFDGKYVHRVVPNFVIQTGCNRGDGFGSEDYSIRSEFSMRRYSRGSVGMASAGKDTEGTQWFITHCPTPHLDGRYTLFAEVEMGMETADRMEVGDQVLEVRLIGEHE